MFELNTRNEQKWFIQLLNNTRWYDVWKIMNQVKPIYLVPGLNMITIYQLAEYFEIPIRLVKNIENKHHLGDKFSRRYVQSDEFEFLAWNKKKINFEGVQHWQYDFKDLSIHMAAAGTICYSPYLVIEFLPYIKGSNVCSNIITKLIKGFNFDHYSYLGIGSLKQSLSDYEAEESKILSDRTKAAEARKLVEKALSDIKYSKQSVIVEVTVNI